MLAILMLFADTNARDSDGLTLLDYALKMERSDAIRVLGRLHHSRRRSQVSGTLKTETLLLFF